MQYSSLQLIIAELLVVVAIIGVLVAISIPIFTSQLEKVREATDAADIRAAYAEVAADALDEATLATAKTGITVYLKQQPDGLGTTPDIGRIAADISGTPKKDGTCFLAPCSVEIQTAPALWRIHKLFL